MSRQERRLYFKLRRAESELERLRHLLTSPERQQDYAAIEKWKHAVEAHLELVRTGHRNDSVPRSGHHGGTCG